MVRLITFLSLFVVLALNISSASPKPAKPVDGIHPIVCVPVQSYITLGEPTHFDVLLSGPATGNESYSVSCSILRSASVPSSITPQPGATVVSFDVTLVDSNGPVVTFTISDGETTITQAMLVFPL